MNDVVTPFVAVFLSELLPGQIHTWSTDSLTEVCVCVCFGGGGGGRGELHLALAAFVPGLPAQVQSSCCLQARTAAVLASKHVQTVAPTSHMHVGTAAAAATQAT